MHLLEKLFKLNKVFGPYTESNISKINWRNYIPQDIREYCVNKINDARAARLKQWQDFLENPEAAETGEKHAGLIKDIKTDNIDDYNGNESYAKSDDCIFQFPAFKITSEKNHRKCQKYHHARKSILNSF